MLLWLSGWGLGAVPPFTPSSDSEVVEVVRSRPLSEAERQLRERWVRPNPPRLNTRAAINLASDLVHQARAEGDPRYLGRAENVLSPWWDSTNAPVDALLLMATIEQGRHEFDTALRILDRAIRINPRSPGAWVTKATILTVQGNFSAARQAAIMASQLSDPLTAMTLTASVVSLTGDPSASLQALELAIGRDGGRSPDDLRMWAHTVAAEIAERLGRDGAADSHFEAALQLAPNYPYVLSAWADYRISRGDSGTVVRRLRDATKSDAVLLRYAEALALSESEADVVEGASATQELSARIAESRLRGSKVHLREESRFELHLCHNRGLAMELARANWRIQKEPVDWRLLVEAAKDAGDQALVSEAKAWAASVGYQDPRWDAILGVRGKLEMNPLNSPTAPGK